MSSCDKNDKIWFHVEGENQFEHGSFLIEPSHLDNANSNISDRILLHFTYDKIMAWTDLKESNATILLFPYLK